MIILRDHGGFYHAKRGQKPSNCCAASDVFANPANNRKFFKNPQERLKTYEESKKTTYNEISWARG